MFIQFATTFPSRITATAVWVAFLLVAACSGAGAQTREILLPGQYYGKTEIPVNESTGNAIQFIQSQKGAFEPIYELPATDQWRKFSQPIGRFDILVGLPGQADGLMLCTAALLPRDLILTNNHCVPEGMKQASILMNYIAFGGAGAERFVVDTKPVERDPVLDYAILKVRGSPATKYGTIKLAAASAEPGQSMVVVHHPAGRPKVMSRFRCLALAEQGSDQMLKHRCDTMGGSSGSLLVSSEGTIVALHHSGGLIPDDPKSFNQATRMTALIRKSALLAEFAHGAVASPRSDPAPAPQPTPDTGKNTKINDILRGE